MSRREIFQPGELESLVEQARKSDPDAWEVLYRAVYARLLHYAQRRLRDREEADDAVSETFARAYSAIDRFRSKGGFEAWLYGILRNVVLESFRASGGKGSALDVDPPTLEAGPLDQLLHDEEFARLRSAFVQLSHEDQEVLELRVVGGLDAAGVAAVLGKRPGAVRMAQSRALERLRIAMEESSREP